MTKYGKGAAFENIVKEILINDGYVAVRSSGSHGLIDVLGIKVDTKLFIQCRTNGIMSDSEKEELIVLALKHKAVPVLAYKKRGGVIFRELKSSKLNFGYEIVDGHWVKVKKGVNNGTSKLL